MAAFDKRIWLGYIGNGKMSVWYEKQTACGQTVGFVRADYLHGRACGSAVPDVENIAGGILDIRGPAVLAASGGKKLEGLQYGCICAA